MTASRAMSFAVGLMLAGVVPAWIVYSADDLYRYVETSDKSVVCHFGYARERRATVTYAGLPARHGYQRDHRVPICIGGADTPANLTYQRIGEALEKDHLERAVCRAVCNGEISLRHGQEMFANDAWRDSYRDVFGREP